MEHTITPRRTYILIYLVLMVLLAATVGAAYLDLGSLNLVATLVIAFSKAALVAMFFMNLRRSSGLMRLFAIGGLVWLGILMLPTLVDFMTQIAGIGGNFPAR